MKDEQWKKLLKEGKTLVKDGATILKEEYIELMHISEQEFTAIAVRYYNWEKASYSNYPELENEEWNTKDAKIEILEKLLGILNRKSKNKDKITIK